MPFKTVIAVDRSHSQSPVQRLAYAVDEEVMEVAFATDGGLSIYRYSDVPYEVFRSVCHADSVGSAVSNAVRNRTYEKAAGRNLRDDAVTVVPLRRREVPASRNQIGGLMLGLNPERRAHMAQWYAKSLFG